jgi:uncharacterized membrane protein
MKDKIRFLLIILLALGVVFRFVNLDGRVYWIDEVYTSLRISGYTQAEVIQEVSRGQVIGIEDLQKYQRPSPEKSVIGTVKGLALEEPQIPPLYFILARFWEQIFGHSPAVTRGFSALISLLAFPCIYWLCLELFQSPLTAGVAMALIAVSPFQVIYAKEARNYSLWAVIILLSSWALLRAIRVNKRLNWLVYGTTVALGFYAHLFFALVAIAHGIYVLAIQSFRWSKIVTAYLLASLAGLLAFTPWILIVINYSSSVTNTTGWQSQRKSLLSLITTWVGNISRAFLDLGVNSYASATYLIPLSVLILIIVALVIYSVYFLCKNTPLRVWLFVVLLIAVPALALILPDLIVGGYRSAMSRYLMPCQLGIHLAVAYLLSTKITSSFARSWEQKLWQVSAMVLFSCAVVSCTVSSQAETWWNMAYGYQVSPVAGIINKATQPLVVSELSGNNLGNLLALSYRLKAPVQFQLLDKPPFPQISKDFNEMFLYGNSGNWIARLEKEQNFKREPIYKDKRDNEIWLWKLVKKS